LAARQALDLAVQVRALVPERNEAAAPLRVMNEIIRKGQTGESTSNTGEFGSVNRPESPIGLVEVPATKVEAHITAVSYEAGLSGVMPGVLELLADRGQDSDDEGHWADVFGDLDADDVADAYFEHIGPSIDGIEDELLKLPIGKPSTEDVDHHIKTICEEAGYGGVMPGILDVVVQRHEASSQIHAAIETLTAADVNRYYDRYIGPAIDDVEEEWGPHRK
jgi:hypothetical protein